MEVTILESRPFVVVRQGAQPVPSRLIVFRTDDNRMLSVIVPGTEPSQVQIQDAIRAELKSAAAMVGRKLTI